MSKQVYATPKRKCSRCLYEKRNTEKCSERLWPPAGGYLCPECLVPAAIENLERLTVKPLPEPPAKEAPSITCPECNMKSFNPNDIAQGYCGMCKWWTSHPQMRHVAKADRG